MALESQDEVFVAKLLVKPGIEVAVGQPILITVENESDISTFANYTPVIQVASTAGSSGQAPLPSTSQPNNNKIALPKAEQRFSPAARHIVESKGLDTTALVGTSRGGRISKADVIMGIQSGSAVANQHQKVPAASIAPVSVRPVETFSSLSLPPANSAFKDIPNSGMRKVIARRLTESKATVPHVYVTIECQLDELLNLRKTFVNDMNANISVNDLVIKAAALALRDLPDVRRKWDISLGKVTEPMPCDIAVAVATPTGLITPIVTMADRRGCADINNTVKELAGRAKIGKLLPEEYTGGCFSISNLGMFGIKNFSAVINPPQACILAVGSGLTRVMPPRNGESEPFISTILSVQLSADRRVVDEALASQFLEVFRGYISNPKSILL
jgi:pyruvate dehydrogenase E2 component (dihydrolipoamide acetyltransferase)